MMLSIYHKTSIFHCSQNYGSLTGVTRLKVAENMEGLACLLGELVLLTVLRPIPYQDYFSNVFFYSDETNTHNLF